jgi:hypothetical protein
MSDHAIPAGQLTLTESKPVRSYTTAIVLGSGGLVTVAWMGLLGWGALRLIGY